MAIPWRRSTFGSRARTATVMGVVGAADHDPMRNRVDDNVEVVVEVGVDRPRGVRHLAVLLAVVAGYHPAVRDAVRAGNRTGGTEPRNSADTLVRSPGCLGCTNNFHCPTCPQTVTGTGHFAGQGVAETGHVHFEFRVDVPPGAVLVLHMPVQGVGHHIYKRAGYHQRGVEEVDHRATPHPVLHSVAVQRSPYGTPSHDGEPAGFGKGGRCSPRWWAISVRIDSQ